LNLCPLCKCPIEPANDTEEHIIPQAIGGRRTVTGFICVACNNATGATWDKALFEELRWFVVMLGTKRERGPAKQIRVDTVSGTAYELSPDGGVSHLKPVVLAAEDGKSYRIQARSVDEARMLLRQLQRRFPNVDVEGALASAEASSRPLNEVFQTSFEFGGEQSGRSMVKSALALAYSLGVAPSLCELALAYLCNVSDATPSLANHFVTDLVIGRPERLFNCVAVHGDAKRRRLLGYVEYFGVSRWVIHLSTDYDGPDVYSTYCFDAITGERMPLDVNLDLSDETFRASFDGATDDYARRVDALNQAIPLVRKRRSELALEANMDFAVSAACAVMGVKPGQALDDSQLWEFSGRVSCILAEGLALGGRASPGQSDSEP